MATKQASRATSRTRAPARKRHAEVLEAAARVFHAKGYDATSIQDIADELGILKGSLYYYITSKDDVLFELLDETHRAALAVAIEAVEIDAGPLQKIRAFVEALSRFNADNPVRMGILLHDFRSLSTRRRKQLVRERDRYDQILRELIGEGQQQGIICPDVDPKLAALAAMGMINTIYHWYKPNGDESSESIGRSYADFVINALVCTTGKHRPGHLSARAALP